MTKLDLPLSKFYIDRFCKMKCLRVSMNVAKIIANNRATPRHVMTLNMSRSNNFFRNNKISPLFLKVWNFLDLKLCHVTQKVLSRVCVSLACRHSRDSDLRPRPRLSLCLLSAGAGNEFKESRSRGNQLERGDTWRR